jgi:putative intracellular protease/amidase
MADELQGRRVAILATDGVERVELEQPRQALDQAGASTTLLSIKRGEIAARRYDLEDAGTFAVDGLVSDASVDAASRTTCRRSARRSSSCSPAPARRRPADMHVTIVRVFP